MSIAGNVGTVPELRFPEFEGGLFEVPLGDAATFEKGKGISKADIVDNGTTPCIRYGELYTLYGTHISSVVSSTNVNPSDLKLSLGNEVIVPASGEDAKDIAAAAVVERAGIALGGDLNIIRGDFEGHFLANYISGKKRLKLASMAQGNSVVHLYPSQLSKLQLCLPSLPEQKKIAAFLGAVDAKIAALKEQQAGYERYKRGMMQALFSQALRFTRSDGTAFPDWEEKKADELFRSVSNKNHNGDLPILAVTQERGAVLRDDVGIDIKSSANSVLSYKIIEVGDFIISLRSFQGGIEYSNVMGISSPAYTILKPNLQIVDGFYKQYFKKEEFISRLSATVVGIRDGKQISYSAFSTLSLHYPHPDEQQMIADALFAMDAKIAAVSDQVTKMEEFKKGLLQQMFV